MIKCILDRDLNVNYESYVVRVKDTALIVCRKGKKPQNQYKNVIIIRLRSGGITSPISTFTSFQEITMGK